MKLKAKEVVRGATRIAFANDQGEKIEAGTIFVDASLDKEGSGFGFRTAPMKCKDLAVIDRIKHLPFPFIAELDLELNASAKTERLVVLDIRPMSMADGKPIPQGAPAAAAAK